MQLAWFLAGQVLKYLVLLLSKKHVYVSNLTYLTCRQRHDVNNYYNNNLVYVSMVTSRKTSFESLSQYD